MIIHKTQIKPRFNGIEPHVLSYKKQNTFPITVCTEACHEMSDAEPFKSVYRF